MHVKMYGRNPCVGLADMELAQVSCSSLPVNMKLYMIDDRKRELELIGIP